MDEQYRKLYHRNKRLETKLRQRIDELDDTKKVKDYLRLATSMDSPLFFQELQKVNTAFQCAHSLASQMHSHLKEVLYMICISC